MFVYIVTTHIVNFNAKEVLHWVSGVDKNLLKAILIADEQMKTLIDELGEELDKVQHNEKIKTISIGNQKTVYHTIMSDPLKTQINITISTKHVM